MAAFGIRNNNPGNIMFGSIARLFGATPIKSNDHIFSQFPTMEQGIRAIMALQQKYTESGHLSVAHRIGKWAPPIENDTAAYIAAVSRAMGVDPDEPLHFNDPNTAILFTKAVIDHENGHNAITRRQIAEALYGPNAQDAAGKLTPSITKDLGYANPETPAAHSLLAPEWSGYEPSPAKGAAYAGGRGESFPGETSSSFLVPIPQPRPELSEPSGLPPIPQPRPAPPAPGNGIVPQDGMDLSQLFGPQLRAPGVLSGASSGDAALLFAPELAYRDMPGARAPVLPWTPRELGAEVDPYRQFNADPAGRQVPYAPFFSLWSPISGPYRR